MTSVNLNSATRLKNGLRWPAEASDLDIELICYRDGSPEWRKATHLRRCVDLLWNRPESKKKFIWHPWAEEMAEASAEEDYLAIGGCASSGKTDYCAVEGIVEWLCAPHATQCLFTSTSLKDSRKRIWSSVEDYFQAVPGMPGKLVSSQGVIRFEAPGIQSDKYGVTLVAADQSREKEAIGKMMGFKAPRMRLYADELPELALALLNTAYSNLARNEDFRMRGLGNPKSHYDAFGLFSEPEGGWKTVNETMYRWRTKRGLFIRFVGERSPNILAGKTVYSFLTDQKDLDDASKMGTKSAAYYRMIKGFWCPTGSEEAIYSENEIEGFRGTDTTEWEGSSTKVRCAALDPAFTNGGDACILRFGTSGKDVDGVSVIDFDEVLILQEDVLDKSVPRTHQLAKQIMEACVERRVHPRHFAMDVTGAGGPFADVLAVMWSDQFLRVYFGGAASELPVSSAEPDVASNERYVNRVSELWWSGKEFLRAHQIRGLDPTTIIQMTSRRYVTQKRGTEMMLRVETKLEMKARIGLSPDYADAAFVLIDLARARLGFTSGEKVPKRQPVVRRSHGVGKHRANLDMAGLANRNLQ